MRFTPELLQRIRDSVNIVDLIGSYVPLKKQGNRYWACCPFHHEKTPSFAVSPDRGFYYCFGCHEKGDVFTFIEKMDSLSFPDAVARLAEAAHIELPQEELSPEEARQQADMNAMYEAAALAQEYFYSCLTKTRMGEPGLAYFGKRHLTKETIDAFKLGFAPNSWDKLIHDFTTKKQISPRILAMAGLAGEKDGRYYDMFRNRCMFPILNLKGKPVAFGGRVMDDSKPKYLNSPETPIFNKRRLLFALYQALPEIRRKRQAIMVEGYMDAISLHAHGVTNVVASLGTAFTIEQARLLKRYADEVVFSYDMDAAGQNATRRALEIAGPLGLKLRVARVGEGKDPDEFVNLHGGEAYLEAVRQAQPAMDYLFSSLLAQNDPTSLEGQHNILDAMFSVLIAKNDSLFINNFIRKMAQTMRISEGIIRSEAARYVQKNHANIYISAQTGGGESRTRESKKDAKLEEGFLRYCLQFHVFPDDWEQMKDFPYTSEFASRLAAAIQRVKDKGQPLTQQEVQQELSQDDVENLGALLMKDDYAPASPWEEYVRPLVLAKLQREYKAHTARANELSHSDPTASMQEMRECIRISQEIRKLQQEEQTEHV